MNVTVKWGAKTLKVQCFTNKPVTAFLQDLQCLTGVPVDRMKLMMRRKQIKATDEWTADEVKEGSTFMLIGTAELAPVPIERAPEEEEVNDEDPVNREMTPTTLIGLKNYGNTCYLNSCLQTLRSLTKLTNIVKESDPPQDAGPNAVTKAFANFIRTFPDGLLPLIVALRNANPMFSEKDPETGASRQQDASECWGYLMTCLRQTIGPQIDELFNIGYQITETCPELEGRQHVDHDADDRLRCFIDQDTRQIEQGIKMDSQVEKRADELGRDVVWNIHRAIEQLPPYLTIQMMRFTYKKDEETVAKIVRKVTHPTKIDTLPWLAPDLRAEVVAQREAAGTGTATAGYYKLKAILTHRGRSANSGHYITHVRVGEQWFRYDDEKVTEITEDDVENLSGTADWHCSFLLIYEQL